MMLRAWVKHDVVTVRLLKMNVNLWEVPLKQESLPCAVCIWGGGWTGSEKMMLKITGVHSEQGTRVLTRCSEHTGDLC